MRSQNRSGLLRGKAITWVTTACAGLLVAASADAQEAASAPPAGPSAKARVLDLSACSPLYPPESLEAGEFGNTNLWMKVSASGALIDAGVARSSGSTRLDRAALAALVNCKFVPAVVGGLSVESTSTINFRWRLEDRPAMADAGCRPEYPVESARAEEQGKTTLQLWLEPTGDVHKAQVLQSSGFPRLDTAAMAALRTCRFKPAAVQSASAATAPFKVEFIWRLVDGLPTTATVPASPDPDPYRPLW